MNRKLRTILSQADKQIKAEFKKELREQGHYNTGALESSFISEITDNNGDFHLTGQALSYANILDEGVRPERASMKQFYFVKEFFISKGYDERNAGQFAAMTINRWMKEGMSTQASSRFSSSGRRKHFIKAVEKKMYRKIDQLITKAVDEAVEEEFNKQKSEII